MSVTRTELGIICNQCIENVQGLLTGVSLLLKDETTRKYALGLYMYAVEEFGKAVLLKKYIRNNKEDQATLKSIFGMTTNRRTEADRGIKNMSAHATKIERGLEHLPPECKRLSPILELKINNSPKPQIFQLGGGNEVLVSAFTTGLFEDTTAGIQKFIEFDYKTRCFYVDLDPRDNDKRNNMNINTTRMKRNVELIKEATKEFQL